MKADIIKQYSVFLVNKPGSLKDFTDLFLKNNINIIAITSDVRYDAAVVRISVEDSPNISPMLIKEGYTSVETDVLSVELPNKKGALKQLSNALGESDVNITTVYGSAMGETSRLMLIVNNIPKAKKILENLEVE
ncbi:MAG: ACT domain-containing protein [Elusimicrobiaceae bacterium]|jgi:hypothetical protein|nr:ACT domain-containing protein [Elusimicrobiaceae bacterium]MBT4008506.1 ACT domain-containing protein [Elusimicrobiaceae bacterium]MBT4403394.1 ACT domain-containing protein [Elusimicrobiaceae bacterium]MBT4440235.1 ACT domain-containing protein [Elusimicrobiaceae bacterium]MBT5987659.1 ACT domain-containing protein [Elusimicrobiaceae bacterium]